MNSYKAYFILLIACFGMQCSSAQNQQENKKGMQTTVMQGKSIKATTNDGNHYVSLESGEFTVFELTSTSGGDPRNDTQIKTSLIFQISPSLTNFDMSDITNSYLQRHCRCIDAGYNLVTSGTVTGKKNKNGTWSLTVDISAEGNDTKNAYLFKYSGVVPNN